MFLALVVCEVRLVKSALRARWGLATIDLVYVNLMTLGVLSHSFNAHRRTAPLWRIEKAVF